MDLNEPRKESIKDARSNFLFSGNDFKKTDYYNLKLTRNSLYKNYIAWENKSTVSSVSELDIVISKTYFTFFIFYFITI